jgi:glycosyltransferase involved in cell wall biosynthesis
VSALALVASTRGLDGLPPVVLTGRTEDPRNPAYFDTLMSDAAARGVAGHFRHLGLVSYEDVFGLNASADALINPSLFEGWSTTVEEAKALGTRMILSDIGVHREQAPDARFFKPDRPDQLASLLVELADGPPPQRPSPASLRAIHSARRQDYAEALFATFARAMNDGGRQH